ncbi:MAG: hypothetical protein ACKVOI_09930 [Dongiaceae bacterium]
MKILIARYVSVLFIAAIVGLAAQFVVFVAAAAVTYPNGLWFVMSAVRLFGLLALSTMISFGLVYTASHRLRKALSRRQAAVAFAVSGAIGPAIPYLRFCTGHLTRCFVENARDAVLGSGAIFSGAILGLVFFTISWQLLHLQGNAT